MNYLDKLLPHNIEQVCELIGARELRQNFRTNSNDFSDIKPGYRPKTISDEEALSLTVENVSKRFISKFLNKKIQSMIDKVTGKQTNLMEQGIPSDEAMIIALANSPFSDNLDLYFRLVGPARSTEEINALKVAARIAKGTYRDDIKNEAPHASEEESLVKQLQTQNDYSQRKIQQLQDLLKSAQVDLQSERDNVTQLQSEKSAIEDKLSLEQNKLAHYRELERCSISYKPDTADEEYPYRSLCKVYWIDGYVRLKRISDIQYDEVVDDFLEEYPLQRDLYNNQRAGTYPEGYIGIWDWKTAPNKVGSGRDYIKTNYSSVQPTQVAVFNECDSVEAVIKKLTLGVSEKPICDGILYAYWNGKKYEGVYCRPKDLDINAGHASLKHDVFRLPVYEIYPSCLYQVGTCQICTALKLGIPKTAVNVKDSMDVLKAMLRKRLTWNTSKQRGMTNATHQQITAYLQELPNNDFVQELASQCNCSEEEAAELIQKFVKNAYSYLSASDIEDETLSRIVRQNPELENRCKELLEAEWEEINAEKINAAEAKLNQCKDAVEEEEQRLEQLIKEYASVEHDLKESRATLEGREQLAAEVERNVAERIAKAQKNAADFIAEQAFLPQSSKMSEAHDVQLSALSTFTPGKLLEDASTELHDVNDVVDYMADNLIEAGVQKGHASGLAAYLYSAYLLHTPVLLAGPNGMAIAQAFSITLFGRTVATLSFVGDYERKIWNECEEAADHVVAVMNPFCAGWSQQLPTTFFDTTKFFFLLSPYAEDLQVEPKGVLNYVLPLVTELFVDKKPTGEFISSRLGSDFAKMPIPKVRPFHKNILAKAQYSMLAQRNYWSVFAGVDSILNDDAPTTTTHRYLFGLLPLTYFVGKNDLLVQQLEKDVDKLPKDFYSMIHEYFGDDE